MSGGGLSNVGTAQIYEDGDQKNYKQSEIQEMKKEDRFHEGKPNSHLANDSSTNQANSNSLPQKNTKRLTGIFSAEDERSIANKLAREEKRENEPEDEDFEVTQSKKDPTLPVRLH